jgi:hypothetical protein
MFSVHNKNTPKKGITASKTTTTSKYEKNTKRHEVKVFGGLFHPSFLPFSSFVVLP